MFHPLSLRTKLILSFLGVIVLGAILTMIFGSQLVKNTIIDEAQEKVKYDLSSAWMVFNDELNRVGDIISFTAEREGIRDAIINKNNDILLTYLSRVKSQWGLDVLTLTDSTGRVTMRMRNPQIKGDDKSQDEIIKKALNGGNFASPQIVSREELLKEGEGLADRAYMEFVSTPKASPRPEAKEINGMMLKAASSVEDESGNLLGVHILVLINGVLQITGQGAVFTLDLRRF